MVMTFSAPTQIKNNKCEFCIPNANGNLYSDITARPEKYFGLSQYEKYVVFNDERNRKTHHLSVRMINDSKKILTITRCNPSKTTDLILEKSGKVITIFGDSESFLTREAAPVASGGNQVDDFLLEIGTLDPMLIVRQSNCKSKLKWAPK